MTPRGRPKPVLFLTVFLDLLGFGIVIPLLPFVAESTGATPLMVTALMASYSLMQFLVAPLWGRLSDRIGRRPVLLMSVAGSVVGLVGFALAQSYLALLAARMLHGAMNANLAVAQAALADLTPPEGRAKAMGLFGAAFGLGFLVGPATGGLLGAYGLHVPALAAAGLAALNLLLAFLLLPESRAPGGPLPEDARPWRILDVQGLRDAARQGPLGAYLLAGLLVMVGFSAMESTFALWSERTLGWHAWENGWFFSYLGALVILVQGGLIGPLRRRHGEARLALVGLALLAPGLALLPFATRLGLLLVATGLLALGNGLLQPNLSALVSFQAPPGATGRTMGLHHGVGALGRVVGPLLAGLLFTFLGPRAPFLAGSLLALLALAVLLRGRAATPRRRDAAPLASPP